MTISNTPPVYDEETQVPTMSSMESQNIRGFLIKFFILVVTIVSGYYITFVLLRRNAEDSSRYLPDQELRSE